MTKFLLLPTDQNGLSHVIRPQEVYLLVPTLWLNSVKLKGVSSRFYYKTYEDKWYINIIIVYTTQFIFCKKKKQDHYFILLVLSAYSACDWQMQSNVVIAISVSQHCKCAFRTPFICLCAPYMKRHSLRRSIEPKEGHKTTGAATNIFSILYLMYSSKCSL